MPLGERMVGTTGRIANITALVSHSISRYTRHGRSEIIDCHDWARRDGRIGSTTCRDRHVTASTTAASPASPRGVRHTQNAGPENDGLNNRDGNDGPYVIITLIAQEARPLQRDRATLYIS